MAGMLPMQVSCFRTLIVFILSIGLTACMVGPNFKSPLPPATKEYVNPKTPLPKKTVGTPEAGKGGKVQHFNVTEDIPAEWWSLFHSDEMNCLIVQGLANNPTLAAAKATLKQAQDTYYAQFGALLLPALTGNVSAERELFSSEQFGSTKTSLFNLFNTSVNVTYTLDVFGGARRQMEFYQAQVDFQRFELIAAYLTLTSNIVTTAITIASLEAQLKATRELAKAYDKQLVILRKQFNLGGISANNVLFQETQVQATRALIPPLENALSQNRTALAVLIGVLPSEGPVPTIDLEKLNLPGQLPESLPSLLVKQRPDIQAAEALLHAASAQIGVATANLFPSFTITGNYGWSANFTHDLFKTATKFWNYGIAAGIPLFEGGALVYQRRAAIDAYKVALEQYRQTVLQAFKNVADALRAIQEDAIELKTLKKAEIAAGKNYNLTTEQFNLGGTSYVSLLFVQQQYQQALINRIKAQAIRYADTAALFQALGGGWWNTCTELGCCRHPPCKNLDKG